MRLLDVSDPARPRRLQPVTWLRLECGGGGDQVYVAAESGGLVILRHVVLQPLYLPLVR
ncbi:MAG: hypothetical protein IPO15_14575 [Anaerolineae bacterium]|uniref:hypothetical protein n=1 Tax=Candidatus Amarolinea dominans TaxID=3140696 RepID=UPI00313766E7|nr:hypothetical protein [Anaerolineae bacterium]